MSAFFAGLAFGGFVIGRSADRLTRPLLLYAILEVGIALLGIVATLLLAHAALPLAAMENRIGVLAWLLSVCFGWYTRISDGWNSTCCRPFLALGRRPHCRARGGAFYAANTAGGIAGALFGSFAFLPWFGVRGTAFAAAALNLMSATHCVHTE